MNILKIYSQENVAPFLNKRNGETKFGENVCLIEKIEEMKGHPAKYVLLGIPEDIGVRANYGFPGTSKAWNAALGSLLNIQSNSLTNAENVILLGEIDCDKQMEQANTINSNEAHFAETLGELVTQIDHKVTMVLKEIIAAGKFPIVIGGGHNNSYGNLMGTSTALGKKVNCINFDAHTDFRSLEHRHSGNGFSYAFEEGYLDRYFVFGLHRNYTSQNIFDTIVKNSDRIKFNLFEDISISRKISFSEALKEAELFCCDTDFGIELDMDAIEMMGSSALSPSGFSITEARKFVNHFSKLEHARYLHICEGAPGLGVFSSQVGKAIAYLVSDVIFDS